MAQSTLSFATSAPARSNVTRSVGVSARTAAAPQRTRQVARAAAKSLVETPETLEYVEGVGRPVGFFIDDKALMAKSEFPLPADVLIEKAKYALEGQRFAVDASIMDVENFEFCAPVVGPLGWKQFSTAVQNFNLEEGFDLLPCYYDFRVDPYEPNRVWFTSRIYAKNTGPLLGKPATNKIVDGPPQCSSFMFNEEGKITDFTIGYVMDKRIGNTGGLGGIYGLLYAVGYGLPFREAQPWTPSLRYKLFQFMGQLASRVGGGGNDS